MYILGINSAYHESSACLIKDGKIIAAAEEERFTRVKHAKKSRVDNPNELPWNAIQFCLREAGELEKRDVTLKDIGYVGYSLNPAKRYARNVSHDHKFQVTPNDFGTKEGEEIFYQRNLQSSNDLRRAGFLGYFHYLNHHDCHAASSFFVSPFRNAAVLVIDGIGEFESTTLYIGSDNKLERLLSIDYPNSLGFLWEKIAKFMGFTEYDACKVMGMAPYGNPRKYRKHFKKFINVNADGTFSIDDKLVMFRNEDYSELEQIFGFAKRTNPVENIEPETQKYADLATALQELTNVIIIRLARTAKEMTHSKYLCLSGGVTLNCATNGELAKTAIFDDIFIQPAAHDGGTAIGAAFYIWNQLLKNDRSYVFDTPYLGPSFSDDSIKNILDKEGLLYSYHSNIEEVVAQLIAQGNIIGYFQGKMEIGPRALGNRSILADPRNIAIVSKINEKVKYREAFRPFCPSVLEERIRDWFNVNRILNSAKYMLVTYGVLPEKRGLIPAVVHVDGTGRLQAVSQESNPRFYALIKAFHEFTGIPMILNTSFNDQEPIVCTPTDAVRTFLKTSIDYLAVGNFLVSKSSNMGRIRDIVSFQHA